MKPRKISSKEMRAKPVNKLIKIQKKLNIEYLFCDVKKINNYEIIDHLKK
jgi:hypothetical protein